MPARPRISRRTFLKSATAVMACTGVGALGYAWRIEPHWIQTVRRALPIVNLPKDLQGRTVVHISDLHVGPRVDEDYLIGALQRVARLKADILVMTGDFMTYRGDGTIEDVRQVLRHLQPGRLATIGILGNHDYGRGFRDAETARRVSEVLRDSGVMVLRNSMLNVEGLEIVGVDDVWSGQFAPERILPHLDSRAASLVLCHNPDALDLPVWSGYRGWILAGHTHGGQCSAPWFGPPILPVKNKRYTSGEIQLADGRRVYINRGLGHLHRVRFNCRPEITVFELARA